MWRGEEKNSEENWPWLLLTTLSLVNSHYQTAYKLCKMLTCFNGLSVRYWRPPCHVQIQTQDTWAHTALVKVSWRDEIWLFNASIHPWSVVVILCSAMTCQWWGMLPVLQKAPVNNKMIKTPDTIQAGKRQSSGGKWFNSHKWACSEDIAYSNCGFTSPSYLVLHCTSTLKHAHIHACIAHTYYCMLKWPGEQLSPGSSLWMRATVLSWSFQTKQHNSSWEGPPNSPSYKKQKTKTHTPNKTRCSLCATVQEKSGSFEGHWLTELCSPYQ